MNTEFNMIEHAREAHALLPMQIAALERVTGDRYSRDDERFWAVRTALRSADKLQDVLTDLHDRYCDPAMGGRA